MSGDDDLTPIRLFRYATLLNMNTAELYVIRGRHCVLFCRGEWPVARRDGFGLFRRRSPQAARHHSNARAQTDGRVRRNHTAAMPGQFRPGISATRVATAFHPGVVTDKLSGDGVTIFRCSPPLSSSERKVNTAFSCDQRISRGTASTRSAT